MPPATEKLITLTFADHPAAFHVCAFQGREALNEPFHFNIEIVTDRPLPDLKRLFQTPAFLRYGRSDEGAHGVIAHISEHTPDSHHWIYRLALVPTLQCLDWRTRNRVFHDVSVPQILRSLLETQGISPPQYRLELSRGLYPPRSLCIQYAESDLQLLQRLCEEEGIHYRFEHCHTGHVLVLADDPEGFIELSTPGIYRPQTAHYPSPSGIRALLRTREPQPSEDGRLRLHRSVQSATDDTQENYARQLGRRALERLRCRHVRIQGLSDRSALASGRILQIQRHPRSFYNDHWLLTEVHHIGKQPLAGLTLEEPPFSQLTETIKQVDASLTCGYSNQFEAIPWTLPFRPQRRHAKPTIPGYQPAMVVGEVNQPAAIDSMGRIRVRLQWSFPCEPPMSSFWAHLLSTDEHLPLGGSQVLVSFANNDPDQPIITGYLNEDTRDRTAPGPDATNEPAPQTLGSLSHWLFNA